MLSLGLTSSVCSKSGLSELEGSLQGGGGTDLDELYDASLIGGESSDLLHNLTDYGVPRCESTSDMVLQKHTLA